LGGEEYAVPEKSARIGGAEIDSVPAARMHCKFSECEKKLFFNGVCK
jgi:hypothetical protein